MLKNKWIYVLLGFIIFSYLIGNYNKKSKEEQLSSNTRIVKGIFVKSITHVNTGIFSLFLSKYGNQEIYFEIYEFRDFLKKGDTVLIKYSMENPTIAKVIDFCYMQKYKGKCR